MNSQNNSVPPDPCSLYVAQPALQQFASEALTAAGARRPDADLTAEVLVAADLAGVDSHGIARLRRYVTGLRNGTIDANAQLRLVRDQGAVLVVDAENGLGQPALAFAVDAAAERAHDHGIAAAAVRRSNHIGIAGWYAERAARSGHFALVTTNASPQVSPAGAAQAMFGTNPLSYAVPQHDGDPLCFDAATSIVPRGKLERLWRERRPMLPDWALDPHGEVTTDTQTVVKGLKERAGYTLLPLGGVSEDYGGHKGSGLALLAELLCGPLAGTAWSLHTYGTGGADLGQFVICLKISAFGEYDSVAQRVAGLTSELRAAAPRVPGAAVRLPGERRRASAEKRSANGIPLLPTVVAELRQIAREAALELPVLTGEPLREQHL